MSDIPPFIVNICPRVRMRMACMEGTCAYPFSEAAEDTDPAVPHFDEQILGDFISGDIAGDRSTAELMRRLGLARQA